MGRLLQHSQAKKIYKNIVFPGSISKIDSQRLPSPGASVGHTEDQIYGWLHQWQPNKLRAKLLIDVLLFRFQTQTGFSCGNF